MKDGIIEERDDRISMRYERAFGQPCEVVWRAITNPDEIQCWSGSRPEINPTPGGEYVTLHSNGERVVDRILRFEPPTLFEHTFWEHINPTAAVMWRLHKEPGGCRLTLTHSLALDDIRQAAAAIATDAHPAVIISRTAAGWHHILDMLEGTITGQEIDWTTDDQRALQEHYARGLALH